MELSAYVGIGTKFVDWFRGWQQTRRKVRVLVHLAYFAGGSEPYYFLKVTNLSPSREVEITHVWFDTDPRVDILLPERPLPKRLRSDETWEVWASAADLVRASNVEQLGRVLVTGLKKAVKSRRNTDVPPRGFVAGADSR